MHIPLALTCWQLGNRTPLPSCKAPAKNNDFYTRQNKLYLGVSQLGRQAAISGKMRMHMRMRLAVRR